MMKKLLVLMLVLGMASVSQAAWTGFVVGGSSEYSATAGETVRIDLIASTLWSSTGWGGIVEASAVNGDGQAFAANVVDMGGLVGSAVVYVKDALENRDTITVAESGYQANYLGNLTATVSASSVGGISANVVTVSFDYTIDSGWGGTNYYVAPLVDGELFYFVFDEVVYDMAVGSTYSNIADASNVLIEGLHIIPEPMTVLLLSLGGLFLRRRK